MSELLTGIHRALGLTQAHFDSNLLALHEQPALADLQVVEIDFEGRPFILVAEIDSRVLGTAFVVLFRDMMCGDQPFAVVENIVVTSSVRGQGIGTRLMDKIKAVCKENRCTKIMLLSNAKRAGAHKFFEQNGYRGDLKRGFVNYINR